GLASCAGAAEQLASVLVACLGAVALKVPVLLRWLASPPSLAVGVWGALHAFPTRRSSDLLTTPAESVVAPPRVQLAKALLARSRVKLNMPVRESRDPGVACVTVAMQMLGLPTGTRAGEQPTSVLVSCLTAVTTKGTELLRW